MLSRGLQKELLRSYMNGLLEQADKGTWEHSVRVAKLCRYIAGELRLSRMEVSLVTMAGLLHDVGKIFIPEMINFPGELEDRERYVITYHPQFGVRFLGVHWQEIPIAVQEGIIFHHERLDGGGYPYRISGDEIPMFARIVAVADVFDAMSTIRPYRPALPKHEVLLELQKPGYDQSVVIALMKNLHRTVSMYSGL